MRKSLRTLIVELCILFAFCCVACGTTESEHSFISEVETTTSNFISMEITTTTTATHTTEVTMTSTTTTTTTSEVTTSEVTTTTTCKPETEVVHSELPITESERILLCNLVGREYGSDYVPIPEKAKVVAVVMNRVHSPLFPNSIYEVLVQPNQFTGYLASNTYSRAVTESVIQAVNYYFEHTAEFSTSILYFEGDGRWNYFR